MSVLYLCHTNQIDMARCLYEIRRQYTGEAEEVIFKTTRKREVEREFNRIVRDNKSDADSCVEVVRIGYAVITTCLSSCKLRRELWICTVPGK